MNCVVKLDATVKAGCEIWNGEQFQTSTGGRGESPRLKPEQ